MTPALIFLCVLLALGYWLLVDRVTWLRIAAYAALLLAAGAMCALALGTPRSMVLQWRALSGTLDGVVLDEGHAIYVWLTPDGQAAPLALRFAWSQGTAAKMERILAQSRATGRKARVGIGGAEAGDGRGDAHPGKDKHGRGDSIPGDADALTVELAPLAPEVGKP